MSDIEYSEGYEKRSSDGSDTEGSLCDFIENDIQASNIIKKKRVSKQPVRFANIVYDDSEEEVSSYDDDDSEF